MSFNFSIDALVGRNSENKNRDSPDSESPDPEVESRKFSAFSPPNSRRADSNSAELASTPSNIPLSQSWQDVLIPHLQIAAGNPFLCGIPGQAVFPGSSASDFPAGKPASPNSIQEFVQRNALAALHQRQNPLWQQQWVDFIQQSSGQAHQRFFQGQSGP